MPVLPPGLAFVGSLEDGGFNHALAPAVLPVDATGHMVGYDDPAADQSLVVATFAAEPGEAQVVRWMMGAAAGEPPP